MNLYFSVILDFAWSGSTIFQGSLLPEEERSVFAWATFSRPGVYDLNRWRVSVELMDSGEVQGSYIQTPTLVQNILLQQKRATQ